MACGQTPEAAAQTEYPVRGPVALRRIQCNTSKHDVHSKGARGLSSAHGQFNGRARRSRTMIALPVATVAKQNLKRTSSHECEATRPKQPSFASHRHMTADPIRGRGRACGVREGQAPPGGHEDDERVHARSAGTRAPPG